MSTNNPINLAVQGRLAAHEFGVTGAGVTVGIISDSFNDLGGMAADIADGALPADTTILKDGADGTDEGRAMAQIVHDIAPGAAIDFYTAEPNAQGMATAIGALRAAGCQIIVDDITFFQGGTGAATGVEVSGGILDQAIDAAVADGVTYVTAAGNDRQYNLPIYGHASDPFAISVAAMDYHATPKPPSPVGGAITPPQTENFSSLGDTPGKPDLTGPDAGPTSLSSLNPFVGTSAAAPAVAAVAALMMQENPQLQDQPLAVMQLLDETAYPFGEPADQMGAGLVQAPEAVAAGAAADHFIVDNPVRRGMPAVKTVLVTPMAGDVEVGSEVTIAVTLGAGVTVSGGTPSLMLNNGGTAVLDLAQSDLTKGELSFIYTAAKGQQIADLDVTAVNPNGAMIEGPHGVTADFSALLGVPTNISVESPLKVKSVSASSGGAPLAAGTIIDVTVTMNRPATVNATGGLPIMLLNDGAIATYDANASDTGAGRLVFAYTIGPNDSTADLTVTGIVLPYGSTVQSKGGYNADFTEAEQRKTGLNFGVSPFGPPEAPALMLANFPGYGGLDITDETAPSIEDRSGSTAVTFYVDGAPLRTLDTKYNSQLTTYAATITLPLGLGTYQLAAVSSDVSAEVIPSAPSAPTELMIVPTTQTTFDVTAPTADILVGTGNHQFNLNAASATVTATWGDNTAIGGDGNDHIHFGSGNDTIELGNGTDQVVADRGNDIVALGNGAQDTVTLGNGDNTVTVGGGSLDAVTLGDGDNTLTIGSFGDSHPSFIDFITLGNGNNIVTAAGGGGNNIGAGNGNNRITIASGIASVRVGNGDNVICAGGTGDDSFGLGSGHDTVTGNDGNDVFQLPFAGTYDLHLGSGDNTIQIDTPSTLDITGFDPKVDQLGFLYPSFDLGIEDPVATAAEGHFGSGGLSPKLLSPDHDGTFADTGDRFAYNEHTGELYYDRDGSGAASQPQLVATLANHPTLSAADLYYFTG